VSKKKRFPIGALVDEPVKPGVPLSFDGRQVGRVTGCKKHGDMFEIEAYFEGWRGELINRSLAFGNSFAISYDEKNARLRVEARAAQRRGEIS
jgi:hypothetical protein